MEDIAYEYGLELIETTSERNGYPRNLKKAIIGFNTFDEAEELADRYGLQVHTFERRDGWQLWYRGNKAYGPMIISASDYGDDYSEYSTRDLDNFFQEHVKPSLADIDDFDSLAEFIDKMRGLYEDLQAIGDDAIIITHQGLYYDTVQKETMEWYHDTHHYVIGII